MASCPHHTHVSSLSLSHYSQEIFIIGVKFRINDYNLTARLLASHYGSDASWKLHLKPTPAAKFLLTNTVEWLHAVIIPMISFPQPLQLRNSFCTQDEDTQLNN
jgi:hypothetical protein